MKKALSILLAAVIVLSLSGLTVFAATMVKTNPPRILSIQGKTTLSKGSKASYSATVRAGKEDKDDREKSVYDNIDEDDLWWESSDDDIIDIDSDGDAYAYDYGVATLTCYLPARDKDGNEISGKYITKRSITVRVPGDPKSAYPENSDDDSSVSVSVSSSRATTTTASSSLGSGQIPTSTVTSAVKNGGSNATFKGYESVSKDTVTAAKTSAAGRKITLNFDTYRDGKFSGRLAINPANAGNMAGTVNTGVSVHSDDVSKYSTLFNKYFKNDNMAFIKVGQNGSFGMWTEVVAKVNLSSFGNTKYLYSYNPTTGKYTPVDKATFYKDANGFWHITTTAGGVLIITDAKLSR